jgi:hypothetical protein
MAPLAEPLKRWDSVYEPESQNPVKKRIWQHPEWSFVPKLTKVYSSIWPSARGVQLVYEF